MRTMYDAVTAANIPPNAAMVAGYIDRIVLAPWTPSDWARFPNARKVTIVKKASTRDGVVLDVEPGDATPEQAPGWAAQRRRDGFAYPVIYCNRSTWPAVKQAFAAQGVEPPLYWIATASGRPEIPDGAIAAQYLLDVAPGIDVSAVADYWPGVDPAPGGGSLPTATQGEEEDMERIDCKAIQTGGYAELHPGGTDQARITIYPGEKGVWVDNIFWWGEGHEAGKTTGGLGNNPAAAHNWQSFFISGITTFTCPRALLGGVGFSAASDFYMIARG